MDVTGIPLLSDTDSYAEASPIFDTGFLSELAREAAAEAKLRERALTPMVS